MNKTLCICSWASALFLGSILRRVKETILPNASSADSVVVVVGTFELSFGVNTVVDVEAMGLAVAVTECCCSKEDWPK